MNKIPELVQIGVNGNYMWNSAIKDKVVKCAYCGKKRQYYVEETIFNLIYKQKKVEFCSHTCRMRYVSKHIRKGK